MNTYECPECGAEVEAVDFLRRCQDCGVWLQLATDSETIWIGESVKVRDHTKWIIVKEPV